MNEPTTLLNGHAYTHSSAMGPDYLKRKFAKIKREQEAERERKRESERTTVRVIKREAK